MRQSTKFLFVLVFALSSLLGAMFIGGCSDETNVTEGDPTSQVVGSIEGIVTNATNNTPIQGVTVTVVLPQAAAANPTKGEQQSNAAEEVITTTTDANGYYLIENKLGSGEYTVVFEAAGYLSSRQVAYIPTLEEIVQNDSPPKGDVPYRDKEDDALWPTAASVNVTGQLVAPAPSPELKDDPNVLAAGAAIANVQVTLDYETSDYYYDKDANVGSCGFSFFPNVYTTTTDANGNFSFSGVPATGCVVLRIAPYKVGSVQYSGYTELFDLWSQQSSGTVDLGTFVGSITGPIPVVTAFNFGQGSWPVNVDANLVLTFSQPMDNINVELRNYSYGTEQFAGTWDATKTIYTINPTLQMRPADPTSQSANYEVQINSAKAQNGRTMGTWDEDFRTLPGIAFLNTNLDDYGPNGDGSYDFRDFPLNQNITLTFSMPVNLNNPNGYVDFGYDKKKTSAPQVDSVTASGNTVTIWPTNDLESAQYYYVDFRVYSSYRDDYAVESELTGNCLCFQAENTDQIPGNVANFELDEANSDYPADYDDGDFTFVWDRVPGARWYDLYAKDNSASLTGKDKLSERGTLSAGNPQYVKIGEIDDLDYLTRQSIEINVDDLGNNGFDLYTDDGFYTPFSGGLQVTFAVKARNAAGSSPAFSNALTIKDEVAPTFNVTMVGDADNSIGAFVTIPGEADTTFTLNIPEIEYAQLNGNPTFTTVEAGGDPNYRIQESNISWTWNLAVRDGSGTVVVPAGEVGSGDLLITQIADNSGNIGIDTLIFGPRLVYTRPTMDDTTWEAPRGYVTADVNSTDVSGASSYADADTAAVYLSYDNGTTWGDTIMTNFGTLDNGTIYFDVDDTTMADGTALVGVQRYSDAYGGAFGAIWLSEAFTANGIKVTSPDSTWVANNPEIYDAGGTDSTGVPIMWTSVGITEVVISYNWITKAPAITDTVPAADGQFTWYPPDHGTDYTATIYVMDNDSDFRPMGTAPMSFDVIHDLVDITAPMGGDIVAASSDYNVQWDNLISGADTLPSMLTVDYTLIDGFSGNLDSILADSATWTNLFSDTPNDGIELWAGVPTQMPTNDSAYLRFWSLDDNGDPVIHAYSEGFTISGVKLAAPNGGGEWQVGSAHDIDWLNYGDFADNVELQYSIDGGTNWTGVPGAGDLTNGGAFWPPTTSSYNWNPLPNTPTENAMVRIRSRVDNTIMDMSDSAFTIAGFNLLYPPAGDTIFVGRADSVVWSSIGGFTGVDITLRVIDGAGPDTLWTAIATATPNSTPRFDYTPNQAMSPTIPVGNFTARMILQANPGDAADTSGALVFAQPDLVLTAPNGGETWQIGTVDTVKWTHQGFQGDSLVIEFCTDFSGAQTWNQVGRVAKTAKSFNWTIPNTPSTDCAVRVREYFSSAGTYGLTDESNGTFTIQP